MARVPMVTRTIITTKVNVMCLDIETGEPCNKSVVVPRTYKDDEKLLKKVKEVLETETLKPVYIVYKEEIETLYGMTEQNFIEHAEVQPPRKVAEENVTEQQKKERGKRLWQKSKNVAESFQKLSSIL